MAERTTSAHFFGVEAAREKPIARIVPEELVKVLGSIIQLDGRASEAPDEESLTYEWTFVSTPLGSTLTGLDLINEEGSVVRFIPDFTGPYVIGLTVHTAFRSSEQATSSVEIQAAIVPYTAHLTPDASWIWNILSDAWRLVNDRLIFETMWSGYIQQQAAELLRLFQVDYAKSIRDIQPLFQRRWLNYGPRLDLDGTTYGVFGYEQSGETAFTGSSSTLTNGLILSSREFILLQGSPSSEAIGTDLVIFSSLADPGNTGIYTINRINTSNTGYVLSESTPFPTPNDEKVVAGTDFVVFAGDDEAYSATIDLVTAGVAVGDFLQIQNGTDAGLYKILAVGTPDGLPNDRTIRLNRAPTNTRTNVPFSVLRPVKAVFQRAVEPNTDTVFIPEGDADLDVFTTGVLKGTGTVRGRYEIVVEARHVLASLVGEKIKVKSGPDSGTTYTIAALNSSRTGYLIGASFTEPFPLNVDYEIPLVADISNRVLVLDGRAHEILSAFLDTNQPDPSDGGRGPLWTITLAGKTAPAGREGLVWRIANSIISEFPDTEYEQDGVVRNDLLILRVERIDNGRKSIIPCTVIGAVGTKIAWFFGSTPRDVGENGGLSDQEILDLASDLEISGVSVNSMTGDLVFSGEALEIFTKLNSTFFRKRNYNLPITRTTQINLDAFSIRVTPGWVIRNCRIPIDDSVVSIPALFEYIEEPEVGQDPEGNIILVGKDGSEVVLPDVPYTLLENRDYTVSDESSLSGGNAETSAESDLIRIPLGDLLDRDIRLGDAIDLESGFDQGRYEILEVRDDETLRVLSATGDLPDTTGTGIRYTIYRRTPGRFIRFIEGLFTPDNPAPPQFWAETTFFDNSDYIEDNFGVLVQVTRERLDEFGSAQVTYKGVVSGLMYAWTTGATLLNAKIGSDFLLGLPVTEVPGYVIDVDDSYAPNLGRIMIEDIDNNGERTGLVRLYFYVPVGGPILPQFAGLSINPDTGNAWTIDDFVPPFTPLSNGVIIEDYLVNPLWWQVGGASGEKELQKYHTWQAQIDVLQIDTRDIELVSNYLLAIRPIYTKPEIIAVLFLLDVVTIEDDLLLEGDLHFFDDPAFSLEMTHMVDNTGSPPLRLEDLGSFNTRSYFRGDDLATTNGSSTVSTPRGGLLSSGSLPYINSHFPDPVVVSGEPMLRAGDILYIPSGPNSGRFLVDSVTDDNDFVISKLPDEWPPRALDPAEIVEATGQTFYLQRRDLNPLVTGTGDTTSASNVFEDTSASFKTDGVAVDDWLIIESGADYGIYLIERVGIISAGDNIDLETKVMINAALTASASVPYRIERRALLRNPLFSATNADTTAGSKKISLPSGGASIAHIQLGDSVTMGSGTDAGHVFYVLDVPDDSTIVVDADLTATESGITVTVTRELLDEETPDSDFVFEKFHPQDTVELCILRPQSAFLTVADLALNISNATSTGTNLQVAGVTTSMTLEIDPVHANSGVYDLSGVSGFSSTIVGQFHINEATTTGTFLDDDADFSISGDAVSSVSLIDYEALGILPGDILRIAAGDFVIMEVSTTTLTLTKTTGLVAAVTGKIVRRSLPC